MQSEQQIRNAEAAKRAQDCSPKAVWQPPRKVSTDEADESARHALQRRQTSLLQWLRRIGHQVDFSDEGRDPRAAAAMEMTMPFAEYHGKACPYCGKTMLLGSARQPTREHKIPRCRRAEFVMPAPGQNVVVTCGPCNGDKGAKTLEEFAVFLHARGDFRVSFVLDYIKRTGWREQIRTVGRAAEGAGPENQ